MELLDQEDFTVTTLKGIEKSYVLSCFPAIAGREIIAKYPLSAIPKVGDYTVNQEIMIKLMSYVGVKMPNGTILRLSTIELINNHVPDWETLARIEVAMLRKNTSFFGRGEISSFLTTFTRKYLQSISPMLKDLAVQLSDQIKQRLKS